MFSTISVILYSTLVVVIPVISGFESFKAQIPNGNNVPNPCSSSSSSKWPGVGHQAVAGAGSLNTFGVDFINAGKSWTKSLCSLDSDGDGKSNGEELGDPNCNWQPGQPDPTGSVLSHPAICQPFSSITCQNGAANKFLSSQNCDFSASSATTQSTAVISILGSSSSDTLAQVVPLLGSVGSVITNLVSFGSATTPKWLLIVASAALAVFFPK